MEEEPALQWKSLKWKDGTQYEGLVNNGKLHSHGVLRFPSKDRYEGQFENGVMEGYGVYVWADGTVYRGEWMGGRMHGCGVKIWRRPDGGFASQEGKFMGDEYIGPVLPCGRESAFEAAVDADMAAYQARSFQLSRRPPGATGGASSSSANGNGSSNGSGKRWWWGGGAAAPAAQQLPASVRGGGSQPLQQQSAGPDLPPEARERVGSLLDRLMAADAAKVADAQQRALSRRQ